MDLEIQNAIEIAYDPTSNQSLKGHAFEYLQQLRSNPAAWQVCLSLFTRAPYLSEVVRVFSLETVGHAVQTQQLDQTSLVYVRDNLMDHVRANYVQSTPADPPEPNLIQNKLAQTMTLLFTVMYKSGWESFFDDFWQLARTDLEASSPQTYLALSFYIRILTSVHDEIADVLVSHPPDKQKHYTDLKDEIRKRDAVKIASSWQDTLAKWQVIEPVTLQRCMKAIGKYVSWIDIGLVVNETTLARLFELAIQDPTQSAAIVPAVYDSINVFSEIIAKKMPPSAKVGLIQALNVEAVLARLVSSPVLQDARGSSAYDTDMAETVARLVNNVVEDVVRALDSSQVDDATRQTAQNLLQAFIPHLLRFFSDEYDEVCSTVVPCVTDLLTLLRKIAKGLNGLPKPYDLMLSPMLNAIVAKMRYDDTSDWGPDDGEEYDEAEFQILRKRLRVLQHMVAAIDESLFLNTLGSIVSEAFNSLQMQGQAVNWRDLDLGLLEMYLLGETALRNGGLYQKKTPTSEASAKLIELMTSLIESNAASYPHPAIHLQYMDICVRFNSFFEQHPQYIAKILENFVVFMHSEQILVRTRSWHFFQRFVRALKTHLGNFSEGVVRATSDLLVIKAEVPSDGDDGDMSSNQDSQSSGTLFESQLFLFEAVGCIASAPAVSVQTQIGITISVLEPLTNGLTQYLPAAKAGDKQSLYQIHHLIEAIGTLARGTCEWQGTEKSAANVLPEVSAAFTSASNAILSSLSELKSHELIRTAGRFSFSRLVGVLGSKILDQLPQWIEGILASNSSKDEMATFLRILDQIIFGFKTDIRNILDVLLTPLLTKIFEGFATPPTGTDDELHLGELRREFLNFIMILLNNDLNSVLVSPTNQATFETIINAIEHFAKDTSNYPDAKLAIAVLTRMCDVWGGPGVQAANGGAATANGTTPSPALPGFDAFMLNRMSGLTWQIMTNPRFDPSDPAANRVVGEIALLQHTVLLKTGNMYLTHLRSTELPGLGADEAAIDAYANALTASDGKGFKQYLVRFLQQSRG